MGGFTITKKKGTGLIGLYSGRKIKAMAANGERLTPKQTAKQALRAIERKYAKQGGIVDSAKYYHAGGGNWVRRSKDADRKRTGKVTTDVKKWRRQPHKFDLRGVDTKGSRVTKPKKKVKPLPNYNRIATEFKNEVTKVLKSQNASSIKVGASIKEFKPGDGTTYHTITYTISYENGYPTHEVYSKVDAIEKKFREKHKEAKLLYDRKSVNRTFSKAVSNFALNAWRQENPNSSIETAKKRALRDMLDYKLTQAVLKDIQSDPLSKPIQDVPKKASVKPVRYTKTTRKMRYDASVYDLASDYKYRGAKRAGDAYSLFVKDRMLKPELSAKEFAKVFDSVMPYRFQEFKKVTKEVKLSPSMLKAPAPKGRTKRKPAKPKTVLKGKGISQMQAEYIKKYPIAISKDFRFSLPKEAVDILKIARSQWVHYRLTPDHKKMRFVVTFFDPVAKKDTSFLVKTPTNTKAEKQKIKSMVMASYKKAKAEHAKKIKAMEAEEREQIKKNIETIKKIVYKPVISGINSSGDQEFPPGAKVSITPKVHTVAGKKYVDPKIYVMTVTYKDGLSEPDAARNLIIPIVEKFNGHAHLGLLLEYDIKRSMSPKLRDWIIKNYGKESKYLKPYNFKFENF